VSWLNCWHDFFCAKTYPAFAVSFLHPSFIFTNFSALSENSTFESPIRFCFIHLGVPLSSNLSLPRFCTQYANDFANSANPVLIPVFPYVQRTMARGGGGGKVKCERVGSVFNHEFTPIGPLPNLYFLTRYTATKNSFTLLEITIGQDKIYGWSAKAENDSSYWFSWLGMSRSYLVSISVLLYIKTMFT
jgi:hypothetical protein